MKKLYLTIVLLANSVILFSQYSKPELIYFKFDTIGNQKNYASAPVGNNPATVNGLTIDSTGQFGTALIGIGLSSTTNRLNTGWATNLPSTGWTISFWVKNFPASSSTTFYYFGDASAGSFRLFTGGVAPVGGLILRGTGLIDVKIYEVPSTATVYHLVYTGSAVKVYKNGVYVSEVAQTPKTFSGTGPFLIGGYSTSNSMNAGVLMDEFRMYNRALTDAEVAATWNIELGNAPDLTVTTQAVSSIASTTATANAEITNIASGNATNRGVIYYFYTDTDKVIGNDGVTNVSESGDFGIGSFTASLTGLSENTRYNARAHATNSVGTSYGSRVDFWTLANVPAAPTVNNATSTTLDVAINVNSNPTGTEFAIQETSGNMYVQANGTLGASAVWQTNSNWGTKTVTGLASATSYTFKVKARNGANTETSFSTTTSLSTKTPGLWTGATSTNWHTTTNWDDGVVPTATVDVTIPNVVNKPVIGANAICNNMTIQNGSQLTINATFSLEVKGNFILNTGSGFTNNGVLKFSGTDCHLTDNRSTKVTLGNIVTDN